VIKENLLLKNNIKKNYFKKSSFNSLSKEFNKTITNIKKEINNNQSALNILSKKYEFNFKIKDLKKFRKFKVYAIIGMGGSILGSMAIHNFLEKNIKKKIYFFDDLNEKKLSKFKKNENLKKVLFLVVSKSGNTIETLSNTFTLKILKKNAKNIIVISEKGNNTLFSLSKKLNLFYIEHNKYVGGRYSVLSETGIIPAYLMGINISKLRSKISNFLISSEKTFLKDSSLILSELLLSKKLNNLILLNYSPQLEQFLFWCQQLIAESLGKKGKGFLPLISNVPKDHHSLLQLYLDGPKDKLFYIFSCEGVSKNKISVQKGFKISNLLDKKKLSSIKKAQKEALIKTFIKNKIPYREFKIKKINEEVLGVLFSYFMLETVIVAKLAKINPYDQPAVEQVKLFTKNFLS
tara:strand:+ start:579 stop:1796 length:1218 start_codon:yes stop_codon:yes gene_type:complete